MVTGTRENTTPAVQYLVPKESFLATTHPILHHAHRALALQNHSVARAMGSASETVQLFASGLNSESWQELLQLQQAVWQRLFTLQKGWVRDWKDWVLYFDQIKGAPTQFRSSPSAKAILSLSLFSFSAPKAPT